MREPMRPPNQQPIPVTVVTGFLGAGKTTLLRGLIGRRQSRRLALLINEFGEVAIDGELIREAAGADEQVRIHDFPHGLIAYGDDTLFVPTMQALASRRAGIDHVLIETSGLALPTAVMELLQGPQLCDDFVLDATLAVVDTPLLLSDQFEPAAPGAAAGPVAELFARQLEFADVVVLNKIDALSQDELLLAEGRLRARAPNLRFLELAHRAELDIRLALGLRLHQAAQGGHGHTAYTALPAMPAPQSGPLASQRPLNGHAHSGLAAHSHGLATHKHFHEQDPGWLSFVLRSDAAQPAERLEAALREAAADAAILRCKGYVRGDACEQAVLVQGVRARVTLGLEPLKPAPRRSELVFIGYHINRGEVAALLSARTGAAWR
jgi:cobalamin biosynthesis protein CobW